jgi:hypothetical protein
MGDYDCLYKELDIPELLDESSKEEKLETLKKYVLMGRQVYKNLSLTVVNNETKKICENLDYKISNISSQLNNSHSLMTNLEANVSMFSGNLKNSANRGIIGENYIEDVLKSYYPNDLVNITTSVGHESDIHFTFQDYLENMILIESKFYSTAVTTSQLEKFYYDIERTGVKYAIFISLASPIVGITKIKYEMRNKVNIIYIPNCNFVCELVVYAINFLKLLMDMPIYGYSSITEGEIKEMKNIKIEHNKYVKIRDNIYLSDKFYQSFLEQINLIIQNNYNFWNYITRLRTDIGETKQEICKMMDRLYKNTYNAELELRYIIDLTNNQLQNQFKILKEKYYHRELDFYNKKFNSKMMNGNEILSDNKRYLYDQMNEKGYTMFNMSIENHILNFFKNKKDFKYDILSCIFNYLKEKSNLSTDTIDKFNLYGPKFISPCDVGLDYLSEIQIVRETIDTYKILCSIKINKTKIELEKDETKINLKNLDDEKLDRYIKLLIEY